MLELMWLLLLMLLLLLVLLVDELSVLLLYPLLLLPCCLPRPQTLCLLLQLLTRKLRSRLRDRLAILAKPTEDATEPLEQPLLPLNRFCSTLLVGSHFLGVERGRHGVGVTRRPMLCARRTSRLTLFLFLQGLHLIRGRRSGRRTLVGTVDGGTEALVATPGSPLLPPAVAGPVAGPLHQRLEALEAARLAHAERGPQLGGAVARVVAAAVVALGHRRVVRGAAGVGARRVAVHHETGFCWPLRPGMTKERVCRIGPDEIAALLLFPI
uniref:Putative secreted protein n=1 Tax=Ixodes ricinus TaxID=34613 RepID=A0A6B0V6I9_IXORI